MSDLPDHRHLTFLPGNDDFRMCDEVPGQLHADFRVALPFVRFDPATGRILERGSMARAHILRERLMTGGTIEGAGHWDTHFVDVAGPHREIREKTPCPARLDGLTLRDLPVPCAVEIAGTDGAGASLYPCDTPELELAFDHADAWTVRVLSVPHRPGAFTVATDG